MHESIRKARETLKRLENVEDVFAADNARRNLDPSVPWESPPVRQNHDEELIAQCRGMVEVLADEAGSAVGELQRDLAALRDELNELRAALAVERTLKVIDLPNWRRKHDAA